MRASRMLSILTTLQAKGQVTAPELAEACEVSVRTIYRNIDALAASGVPVYADRGAEGGYRLLDGYRVRLNGLSQSEAEGAVPGGIAGPGGGAGAGCRDDRRSEQADGGAAGKFARRRRPDAAAFYLDAPGWFGETDEPKHLRAIAGAALRGTLIRSAIRAGAPRSSAVSLRSASC